MSTRSSSGTAAVTANRNARVQALQNMVDRGRQVNRRPGQTEKRWPLFLSAQRGPAVVRFHVGMRDKGDSDGWSKNVQAQHPPDEKQRDHGHDDIANPLAGGLWLRAVFHASTVAGWMPTASRYKRKDATAEVYKVDTGLLAELRAIMRQVAEELGQWNTKSEPSTFDARELMRVLNARRQRARDRQPRPG